MTNTVNHGQCTQFRPNLSDLQIYCQSIKIVFISIMVNTIILVLIDVNGVCCVCCCLPQHNELSILHWHFGGGGGGDVFLLRGVHWARLIEVWRRRREGKMGEIHQGEGDRKGKRG